MCVRQQGIGKRKMRERSVKVKEIKKEIDFNEAERNLSQNRMRDLNLYIGREEKKDLSNDENSTEYTTHARTQTQTYEESARQCTAAEC